MTWGLVLALAAGSYGWKVLGVVILGRRHLAPPLERCLALVPAALLSALIVRDTLSTGQAFALDARAVGVAVAAVAAWRRAPLVLVMVLGAVVTALVRRWAGG
jgi:uncharacterized membrane protein